MLSAWPTARMEFVKAVPLLTIEGFLSREYCSCGLKIEA
jgi:hypothetical protein